MEVNQVNELSEYANRMTLSQMTKIISGGIRFDSMLFARQEYFTTKFQILMLDFFQFWNSNSIIEKERFIEAFNAKVNNG